MGSKITDKWDIETGRLLETSMLLPSCHWLLSVRLDLQKSCDKPYSDPISDRQLLLSCDQAGPKKIKILIVLIRRNHHQNVTARFAMELGCYRWTVSKFWLWDLARCNERQCAAFGSYGMSSVWGSISHEPRDPSENVGSHLTRSRWHRLTFVL